MIRIYLMLATFCFAGFSATAEPQASGSLATIPQDARYALLAQQQVQCMVYGQYAHAGTATSEELERLFDGAVGSLSMYVKRVRSNNFEGSENVPIYMMLDSFPTLGTIEFAVGRLFEAVRADEIEAVLNYRGLLPTDFEQTDQFAKAVPYYERADRASTMFTNSRCHEVAKGELQCLDRYHCKQIDPR